MRRWLDDLLSGLLLVPALVVASFALLAMTALRLDALASAGLASALRSIRWLSPAAVREILVAMATSMVTAVALIFSILLVVQSLAAQYSPRVLRSLHRDRTSQATMGVLVGIVVYCFLVMVVISEDPQGVPVLSVLGAALLFVAGLMLLINFIHHVSQLIQLNNILDLVARQTEAALDRMLPNALKPGEWPCHQPQVAPPPEAAIIESTQSGYIQSVDVAWLHHQARSQRVSLSVLLPVGGFATAGVALVAVTPAERLTDRLATRCRQAFRIGPVRSVWQDPECGIRLLVDVALRAISPAVNDPSTACTCVRQLGRLLVRAVGRHNPEYAAERRGTPGVVLVVPSFLELLDSAVTQIRQYSRSDAAVSEALLGVLRDLALETRYPPYLDAIRAHARLVRDTRSGEAFAAADRARIEAACREVEMAARGELCSSGEPPARAQAGLMRAPRGSSGSEA